MYRWFYVGHVNRPFSVTTDNKVFLILIKAYGIHITS